MHSVLQLLLKVTGDMEIMRKGKNISHSFIQTIQDTQKRKTYGFLGGKTCFPLWANMK